MMSKFEQFYSRYPNKTGKKDAQKKWDQKKLDEQWESISKFLDWAPLHDEKWKKGFVPMASTFINQERWNDHDKHLNPRLYEKRNVENSVPDLSQVVEWLIENRNLSEQQICAPWNWLAEGGRIVGVQIPELDPLYFRSFKGAAVGN